MSDRTRWSSLPRPAGPTTEGDERTAPARTHPTAPFAEHRIAAIVPCLNEASAVGHVVKGLTEAVPGIEVYVYDNGSTDDTAAVARAAGAHVRHEGRPGKGNVVRRAFADVEADIYLLIDGDDTYDPQAAPRMIRALLEGPYDHVLGLRQPAEGDDAYRDGHQWGNQLLNGILARFFGSHVGDMLSGYRVMSRRFVKSFAATSHGFEIETELTVHCLSLRTPSTAVPVGFRSRHEGSESKLHTFRDGRRILSTIVSLFRQERPRPFYSLFAALALLTLGVIAYVGHLLGTDVGFTRTGQILGLVAVATPIGVGMVADAITRSRHDHSYLVYMSHPPVASSVPRVIEQAPPSMVANLAVLPPLTLPPVEVTNPVMPASS